MNRTTSRRRRARGGGAVIAIALISALGMLGCGSSTPNGPGPVAIAWLQAMGDEDAGRACELMDASNHRGGVGKTPTLKCENRLRGLELTPEGWKPRQGAMYELGLSDARVWRINHPSKDEAIVWAYGPKGVGLRSSGLRYVVELVREDGHWLVDEMEYPL